MNRSKDWFRQAERDLAAAESNAAAGYHEWAAYTAQQAAEKAVKAVLENLHAASRGHSITGLLEYLPASPPASVLDAARELDRVYLTARYPNGFVSGAPADYFSEDTSRRLIDYARSIVGFCRGQIPGS